jgi:3',5'-cyclic AMP phosphodiesterase CpdA
MMKQTIAHISDLHFGALTPGMDEALLRDLAQVEPDVVAVSGDLTQRARGGQFRDARRFLDALKAPWLAVPGNHDIPLFDVFRRYLAPLRRYRRHIDTEVDPFLRQAGLAILGLNTARGSSWKNGSISAQQVETITARFSGLPPGITKVLVIHHPVVAREGDPSPPIVHGALAALRAAEARGLDLILAGHLHHGFTGDIRTHHSSIKRSMLVAQAGTATSHRTRAEPNSYNLIHIGPGAIDFELRVHDETRSFHSARRTSYVKDGAGGWQPG